MASADRRCFFYGHEIQKVAESKSEAEKIKELDVIKINEQAKELVKQRLGEVGRFLCLGVSLMHSVWSVCYIYASRGWGGGGGVSVSLFGEPAYLVVFTVSLSLPCLRFSLGCCTRRLPDRGQLRVGIGGRRHRRRAEYS